MTVDEDLEELLDNLPVFIQEHLKTHSSKATLIEIVMDLGRRPEAQFTTGPEYLSQKMISWQDLDYTTQRISKFSNENRAGIERTLHRISCIRNRQFLINGLTCRVGRAIFGTVSLVRDLLEAEQSILILGKPGVGKTTIIREIARVLADEMEKRVIIVDTSNEIGGDSDVPHSAIGRARRMQVSKTEQQHHVMIEAVENHMPQVIIIDEIGTELEGLAARTISEKGVLLVGTTHGNCLENLIKNPPLADLIGGIQYVTLSDDEAKRRRTQKTVLERKAYPAFQIALEINDQNSWTIYEDIKSSIDSLLRGSGTIEQTRKFLTSTKINIRYQTIQNDSLWHQINNLNRFHFLIKPLSNWRIINQPYHSKVYNLESKKLVIYSYSLSTNLLKEVLIKIGCKFELTKDIKKASIVIGLKKHLKQNLKLTILAKQKNIPIYTVPETNMYQILKLVQFLRTENQIFSN